MTTLGSLLKPPPKPLDVPKLAHGLVASLLAAGQQVPFPAPGISLLSAMEAWTNQDDDAHETCDALVACRNPLHPGPCKGWKHTLHSVSPGAWHQLEGERVRKANERRLKRISDLKAQGKPIPRHLLTEIKPKPAPGHPAHAATPVPLHQVGQKADLAGGQAHKAGQSVSQAAGVQVKTPPPLPTGPKGKKPTVAGRGPAFVITQPKVTDQYKLDKAAKLTPQEWASLSDADRKVIRDELSAIKQRGFGPQQKKADELLAKLPATASSPAAPVTSAKLQAAQAKVDAAKAKLAAHRAQPKVTTHVQTNGKALTPQQAQAVQNQSPGKVSLGQASKNTGLPGLPATPPTAPKAKAAGPDVVDQVKKAQDPSAQLSPSARVFIYRKLSKADYDRLDDTSKKKLADDLDAVDAGASQTAKQGAADIRQKLGISKSAAPSSTTVPAAPSKPTVQPAAPLAPGTAAHIQHAAAVANRTAPKAQMAKTHLDSYGKLSKADFDALPEKQRNQIRDDLANAKAKFLDPKKQQAAADLLDRFGSRKTGGSPAVATPTGAKGYSDPMRQVVVSAQGAASTDDTLKAVARLSPEQFGKLDDADKKTVLIRLAFIASHPKATKEQKDKAAAYGQILNGRGPAATTKLDHTASVGEIHADHVKTGIGSAMARDDALKAASDKTMNVDQRLTALTAPTKAQFDSLSADDQGKILDALQDMHHNRVMNGGKTTVDAAVVDAFKKYTGQHPALHRLDKAEADFKAGKISSDELYSHYLSARVQAPATVDQAAHDAVAARARKIAEDNPTLATPHRASMAGEQKYGTTAYRAIQMAQNPTYWHDAPTMSQHDLRDLFRATDADLAKEHPIQAQAVKDLQNHVLKTGLRGQPGVPTGSPWSVATRNAAVEVFLDADGQTGEIPQDRLDRYFKLDPTTRIQVKRVVQAKLDGQTDNARKTETWIGLRALEGKNRLTGNLADAVRAAANPYAVGGKMPVYRKLTPDDVQGLPSFVQDAIKGDLEDAQKRLTRGGASLNYSPSDDLVQMLPSALADHLTGKRTEYSNKQQQVASDMANYGYDVYSADSRVRVFTTLPSRKFQDLDSGTQNRINADLSDIARDSSNSLQTRYDALHGRDLLLPPMGSTTLNSTQVQAIQVADPNPKSGYNDTTVMFALNQLSKGEFDNLAPTYREAIDERIKSLPGSDQQLLNAKFHPSTAANNPSGNAATVQATVPPHVQEALDTIYGTHLKSHTMAHQLKTYGALRGHEFHTALNPQEQQHLLSDLSYIATTAKGPSADKARKLIDRFTPPGTPPGQVPTPAVIPPANAVPGQVRYATPLKGLTKAADTGKSGDGWITTPGGKRVWGAYGAAGLLIKHVDPNDGKERYLMVQRGPAISDPGKWTFPGGAIDSKETPHQGAARETIEELGLKDDQLKDALVHGDHTFTIPGSTWKYTTVAAQVDKQFQPNLSTAHARAETSDAKWMTIDEIRALDSKGKLHAPIANGLLEKNVISLYPQGTSGPAGQTLGQVARPAPVTKRQGRLTMPSGGRQTPANFNAWPHAHKKSTGKNLVSDKAAIDKLRQEIKHERVAYDGKTADGRLAAIGAKQGFDDTPTVVSKAEMDRLLATGDYIQAWRGVKGAWGGPSSSDINEQMRSGPAYYGRGIFGNGYYLATQKHVAEQYSDHKKNSIIRVLIPKSAVIHKYKDVQKEARANSSRTSKAKGKYEDGTLYDAGRWAAAKGADGIQIDHDTVNDTGGWARHIAKPGLPGFNWLNRSVLIVQEAD